MGVLIDTSAWIEFYHPRGSATVKRLLAQALRSEEICVTAPIVVELLSGAKTQEDFDVLRSDLQALIHLQLADREALQAAELAWRLARSGLRVPTVDALIAGTAQVHGCEIWHFGDRHFATLAQAGGPPHRDLRQA